MGGPHSRDCARKNELIWRQKRRNRQSESERVKERKRKQQAFEDVKQASSGQDLLESLDVLVEEEWLGGYDEINGNIYRAFALGSFPWPTCHFSIGALRSNAKFFGALTIWLTQIVGPAVMLTMQLRNFSDWKFSFSPWQTNFGDRLLGFLLINAFNLNAFFEASREAGMFDKVTTLVNYFGGDKFYGNTRLLLLIGEVTNCYVFIISCLCTTLVLGAAESTKDILFDALGILFLYNLDDIGSAQLGFVSADDWPGHRLAWLYQQISTEDGCPEPGVDRHIYTVTRSIILVFALSLPCLYVVTDFLGVSSEA